jgi:hypothetical protein
MIGTPVTTGTELLNVNGGFVIGGTVGAGGIVNTRSATPMVITDGVTASIGGYSGQMLDLSSTGVARMRLEGFGPPSIIAYRNTGGSQGAPVALANNVPLGQMVWDGWDGTAVGAQQAIFQVSASGAWTPTNHATYMSWFVTKSNTTAFIEQMRLSQFGNLLIGGGGTLAAEDTINAIQCNGHVKTTTFFCEGITNNITLAGSTNSTSFNITTGLNIITSVPAGSGARMPQGGVAGGISPGTFVDIFNTTTAVAKIYGFGAATIDGAVAATGVTLSGNTRCRYWLTANGTWISTLLGGPSA